ncbi:MAG: glutamine amidotransferase, partial [candidate division KSB1 bacterium]|nr:glutamine amidotransferase [candidate division KSB1 bacterium]
SMGEPLPEYDEISAIVITGSHAMVTDHADWSERTAAWLPGAIARKIPTLGICYGHQLLAYALGGKVADNPNGVAFGTRVITLLASARQDPLFSILPEMVQVQTTHTQSVVQLPPGATLLATHAMDPNHAFVIGDCCWGVQFHPEFDADIVRRYIQRERDYLQAKGLSPDELMKDCFDKPFGGIFLRRFAEIVTGVNS